MCSWAKLAFLRKLLDTSFSVRVEKALACRQHLMHHTGPLLALKRNHQRQSPLPIVTLKKETTGPDSGPPMSNQVRINHHNLLQNHLSLPLPFLLPTPEWSGSGLPHPDAADDQVTVPGIPLSCLQYLTALNLPSFLILGFRETSLLRVYPLVLAFHSNPNSL